ncbi:N(2)-acetyl-L-2,4-diaminobutanoate deacetylase DoeB [Castellaniella hirudinis]|uniref:N(2)-acetyl-L-2,4-diaminobutanoate deacetylase DoeB n=1 Tax=Castellaniella hirudinis TaxID=1144617 RepID=A0ABV8S0Q4_9BURK
MRDSLITPTVDFTREGVQHGFLSLPHSSDASAWGAIRIPLTVVRRGHGPTVLLTGGNHGDEYEGPVALSKLAGSLQAEQVTGCVIIIPFLNYPAFTAGRRTSPIDAGNLNRLFPGNPAGTVTEKIADYVERYLLPMADFVLDIHSGGKTLDFLPFAAIHLLDDPRQQAACEAAMLAFGAPYAMKILELDSVGMLDTAAESLGKVFVSTELGGGGSSTAASVAIADRGVQRFLMHAGVCGGRPGPLPPSVLLEMPGAACYTTCEADGLLEMTRDLGQAVKQGDVIARVYDGTRTGGAVQAYRAGLDGVLAARHFPGLVKSGDTIAVVACEVPQGIGPRLNPVK